MYATTDKTILRSATNGELRLTEAMLRQRVHQLSEGPYAGKPPTPELQLVLEALEAVCDETERRIHRDLVRFERSVVATLRGAL